MTLRSAMAVELPLFLSDTRSLSTQVKAPAQARQMGALRVAMLSPGFIYEPYTPHEKISFFKRWFTRSGCKRTKEDTIIEKFEAYDSNGAVVAGDKSKEVLVRDIWVFEKSLFQP
ncbi:uncharacterized protein [Malus domestica]|uniref:uncharacterized protein n=1 Tax=Malus domestica TaxID=3750 RepID=UPI0039747A62